jgi:hypothetical protein
VIKQFPGIQRCAVDASSMIYMLKAGFLGYTGAAIELITVPPVFKEVGWPKLPVKIYPLSEDMDANASNDFTLILLAKELNIAVLSEDKKLLNEAGNLGLCYYNSLMVLVYLRMIGKVNENQYHEFRTRLIAAARYSAEVIQYADDLHRAIKGNLL